jgi:hypothetical protein
MQPKLGPMAARHRRSVTQETIHLIEKALSTRNPKFSA